MAGEVLSERQARGLIWQYDIGALPGAQRQVSAGQTSTDVLTTAGVVVRLEANRFYRYHFTGSIALDTVGAVADMRLELDSGGLTHIGLVWQTPNAVQFAPTTPTISYVGHAWTTTSNSVTVWLKIRRLAGTGAVTIQTPAQSGVPCMLELHDVGRV